MKSLFLFTSLLTATLFMSCNKEVGEGGTSSITGKVWVVNTNNSGAVVGEYYGMDYDVFIIYGENNSTYSDKFSTSYDGSYAFHYLTPGKYTLFAYSKCDTCASGQDVIKKTVEITEKKQEITVEDLIIYE